jgi:hypothetical protein
MSTSNTNIEENRLLRFDSPMAYLSLSKHDINVLEKIKDPESNPLASVQLDPSLPRDPNITDASLYDRVSQQERQIVLAVQELEFQLAGLRPRITSAPIEEYETCVSRLVELIDEHPTYASARNNRVQAIRRLYGDAVLLTERSIASPALLPEPNSKQKQQAGTTALADLEAAVALLSPASPVAAISPQAAKTLSLAHTQRAAIYYTTAKFLPSNSLSIDDSRPESKWTKLDYEEAASRDFALGGHYGNEVAKGLAVSTNPTAKLCGQMVREAMKKEYGPEYGN